MLELSIIMPCLNEAQTLAHCIREAQSFIDRAQISAEIVIADNGSTDGSQAIAEALGARVVTVSERGYGNALRAGINAARGKYLVLGDSDRSYDFSNIDDIVARLRDGFDFVMGNRFVGGIEKGAMPLMNRHVGTPAISTLCRILFGCRIRDINCGMRGLTRNIAERMCLTSPGMELASEMVAKACLLQATIAEVGVRLRKDGRDRKPHLRPWRDGIRHVYLLISLRAVLLAPEPALS